MSKAAALAIKFYAGMRRKLSRKEGQGFMEYTMIVGGIILVIVLVITLFGDEVMEMFQNITGAMNVRNPGTTTW